MCVAPREVASSGAVVWHEQRVADESGGVHCFAYDVRHTSRGMTRGMNSADIQVANGKALAVSKQVIKLPTITGELISQIE